MKGFSKTPGYSEVTSIGIIRDAEKSADDAFKSVRSACRQEGLPEPHRRREKASGHKPNPSVSVLILPDERSPGMLEPLLAAIVMDSPFGICVVEFLQCAEKVSGSAIKRPEKARAHAFLATQPDPHVSVGVAAQKRYWEFDHPVLEGVRSFLADLCQ